MTNHPTPTSAASTSQDLKQVQALTPQEFLALRAGLSALDTALGALSMTGERFQRLQAVRALSADRVTARDTDESGDVTLPPLTPAEHALLMVATDLQRQVITHLTSVLPSDQDVAERIQAAHSALTKVATASEVTIIGTPLDVLLTASRTLNTSEAWQGPAGLRLWFTYDHDDASGGQGYDGSHTGHRLLLADAARHLHEGRTASAVLSWEVGQEGTLVGHLTPQALACDCGKGLWCPLVTQERIGAPAAAARSGATGHPTA